MSYRLRCFEMWTTDKQVSGSKNDGARAIKLLNAAAKKAAMDLQDGAPIWGSMSATQVDNYA